MRKPANEGGHLKISLTCESPADERMLLQIAERLCEQLRGPLAATSLGPPPVAADPLGFRPRGGPPRPAALTDDHRFQQRAEAMKKGYTGDVCNECGQFRMLRNGTCLKCDGCGATSGCS